MQDFDFDYIIIGGGGAGAVLARRLAESSTARIALLEAGPSDAGIAAIHDLGRFSELADSAVARPVPVTLPPGQRARFTMPTSRVLGGSTSRNTCIWFRPPASDFDDWAARGASGWGPDDVAPHFEALERHVRIEHQVPDFAAHRALWQAAGESGFPTVDFSKPFGAGIGHYWMSKTGRQRQSSAIAYLHPLDRLPANLSVFTETEVLRLIVGPDRTVSGVETKRGTFRAAADVVLCAGAIDTPKLLMLSGIGPAEDLRALGIAPVVDLPGIGRHLLDHPAACVNLASALPVERDDVWNYVGVLFDRLLDKDAFPDIEVQLGPEVYTKQTAQAGYPDAPFGFTAYMSVNRARSEGSVRLQSADAGAHPLVETAYYTDPDGYDLRVMTEGVRLARRLFDSPALAPWRGIELAPGAHCRSDEEIGAYLRETTLTGYHPAGTCRMGSAGDADAVVLSDLRVKTMANLRIADASVMPSMVSVNIAATCMMIGHFAAALITR